MLTGYKKRKPRRRYLQSFTVLLSVRLVSDVLYYAPVNDESEGKTTPAHYLRVITNGRQ